jgi:threonine dehydrogenase-like Zn-dependent dehydrogenase
LVDVKPLITHHYELKEALKAFKTVLNQEDGAIKVIINCTDDK